MHCGPARLRSTKMLKIKKISDVYNLSVFTENGEYFGDIEEAIITLGKVFGWRVKSTKNSVLNKILGSARGVIIPHQMVRSIGDVVIINKTALPNYEEIEG